MRCLTRKGEWTERLKGKNGGRGVEDLKKIVAGKRNESRKEVVEESSSRQKTVVDRKVIEKRLVDAEKCRRKKGLAEKGQTKISCEVEAVLRRVSC